MYRIGLTGGVGSGKSTVSSYLKELGFFVVDGDVLAREAVSPGSEAMRRIRRAFGADVFLPSGELNRARMADIIFSSEEKRQSLNCILHPYIWRRTAEILTCLQENGHDTVILDMPLLVEIGWQLRVEEVWVVWIPPEKQIARVMKRDGLTKEQVMLRIDKQMATEDILRYGDVIIDNGGSEEDTKAQVRRALAQVREKIRKRGKLL